NPSPSSAPGCGRAGCPTSRSRKSRSPPSSWRTGCICTWPKPNGSGPAMRSPLSISRATKDPRACCRPPDCRCQRRGPGRRAACPRGSPRSTPAGGLVGGASRSGGVGNNLPCSPSTEQSVRFLLDAVELLADDPLDVQGGGEGHLQGQRRRCGLGVELEGMLGNGQQAVSGHGLVRGQARPQDAQGPCEA